MSGELKIDIGCGPNKREGFIGIDQYEFACVDYVMNVAEKRLPFDNGTVDEAYSSHFIEHLDQKGRVFFFNELWRVMKLGAKAKLVFPHCLSNRAYGDPTHQWPPIGEMTFFYLKRDWRMVQAQHTDRKLWVDGYICNFEASWGYGLHHLLENRNQQYKEFAVTFYKEAIQDMEVTLTKLE